MEVGSLLDELLPVQKELIVLAANFVENLKKIRKKNKNFEAKKMAYTPHHSTLLRKNLLQPIPEPLLLHNLLLLFLLLDFILLFFVFVQVPDILLLLVDKLLQKEDDTVLVVSHDSGF